ncbi:MAG: DUF262 domain-containing protein, partial [Myxococcota bacterium]
MATDSHAPTLDRKPKAEILSIEDLVQAALDGQVRVPRFQRPLRWTVDDVCTLLDSVYRGYPIGTLLFWRRPGPAEPVRYGPRTIEAPARGDVWTVIDGQQRIDALVRSLTGDAATDPFAVYFDLVERSFVAPRRGGVGPAWIPVSELFDSRRLVRRLGDSVLLDAALDASRRLREYALPLYVVATDDEDAVREIFRRLNDTGKRLDDAEVFDAVHRGRLGEGALGLRDVAQRITDLGHGAVSPRDLNTMMRATRRADVSTKRPTWPPDEAARAIEDLLAAATRAVRFLVKDAAIPHLDLLPYVQPLIVLARLFHLHPEPSPRNRVLLARWVWRGATEGLHTGEAIGMRASLAAVDADEDASVQRLLRTVRVEAPAFDPQLANFRLNTARSRVVALALVDRGPRHLLEGRPLSIDEARGTVALGQAGGRSAANRLIHPRIPHVRTAVLAVDDPQVLAGHVLPAACVEALRAGDLAGAVAIRE